MGYQRKDHYYRQARDSGYRSRAAYKLIELDQKYRFLAEGQRVLELGSFPGGWTQVSAQRAGAEGKVVGIDLRPVAPFAPQELGRSAAMLHIIEGDINAPAAREQLQKALGGKCHVLLSDMSPSLSGIRFRDVARCADLIQMSFEVAEQLLLPGGSLVAKAFPGPDAEEVFSQGKELFKKFNRAHLKSTRKTSSEIYFVGTGFAQ